MLHKIRNQYTQFSRSEKIIADYFLKNSQEVINLSIHDLAAKIGTSSSSISRFVRKINDKSFAETKVDLAKNSMQENYKQSSEIISLADEFELLPSKLLSLINQSCNDIALLNPISLFTEAIDLLENADVVYFFGVGASSLIATDLQQKLIRIGKKCIYHHDSNFGVLNSTTTTSRDVVVAISYTGHTREVLIPVRRSKENGAKIITFTNESSNPLMKMGDVKLLIPDRERAESRISTMFSRYEQLYIIDILFLGLSKRIVKSPEKVIDDYHTLLKQLKEK